jgi:LysM repeat protein
MAAATLSGTSTESLISSVLQAPLNSNPHPPVGDTSRLIAGQALMNDHRPTLEHTPEESGEIVSDQISVYVVREGDTLSTIAEMFDVTENTIRWANDLNSKSVVRKDQQLIILPISGIKYTIKKGDSLRSIASSFKSDQSEIIAYNNMESASDLKVGSEIIIPNGEITTTVTSTNSKAIAKAGTTAATAKSSGYFIRPSTGKKSQGIHGHNGVDIASSLNTPIVAAAGGKVIIAKQGGWNGGYGSYVVISHANGMQTLYAHMSSLTVSVGQTVTQGNTIGYMGSTGQSSGVHLHFEVRGGANPF